MTKDHFNQKRLIDGETVRSTKSKENQPNLLSGYPSSAHPIWNRREMYFEQHCSRGIPETVDICRLVTSATADSTLIEIYSACRLGLDWPMALVQCPPYSCKHHQHKSISIINYNDLRVFSSQAQANCSSLHYTKVTFPSLFTISFFFDPMSSTNVCLIVETLPPDIRSYIDEQFCSFVSEVLGKSFSNLLEILQNNSTSCFLMTDDLFHILDLDVDHQPLTDLKKSICFQLKDCSALLKPGIKSVFKCFKQALLNERETVMKHMKRNKKSTHSSTIVTGQPSSSVSSSLVLASLEIVSQSYSLNNAVPISLAFHKDSMGQSINRWCQENKSILGFTKLDLKDDGIDYTSRLTSNDDFEISAEITCRCGVVVKLTNKHGRVQLLNFYKHLRQTNCSHISRLRELEEKTNETGTAYTTPSLATALRTSPSADIEHNAVRFRSNGIRTTACESSTHFTKKVLKHSWIFDTSFTWTQRTATLDCSFLQW